MGFDTFNPILNCGGIYVLFITCLVCMSATLVIFAVSKVLSVMKKIFSGNGIQKEGGSKSKKKKEKKVSWCRRTRRNIATSLRGFFFNKPLLLI